MQAQQPWQRDGAEHMLCIPHNERFQLPAGCPKCGDDPAPALNLDDPELVVTPDGCMSVLEIERAAVSVAQDTRKYIKDRQRKKGGLSPSAFKDLQDLRLKALRLAADKAQHREDDEVTRRRLAALAKMRGVSH